MSWLEATTGWLALALYRAALRRMIDGRLSDDTGGGAATRLVEIEAAYAIRATEARAERDRDANMRWLADRFGLAPLERDLLALAVASERATALLPALATLRPSGVDGALHAGLLAELVASNREDEAIALDALAADATLGQWALLRFGTVESPYVARTVSVPKRVVAAAIGGYAQLDVAIAGAVRELPVKPDPRLAALGQLGDVIFGHGDELVMFGGPAGCAPARLLAALAAERGHVVLELALQLADDGPGLESLVRIAARDARLRGGILALAGLDAVDARARRRVLERCCRTLGALERRPVIVLGGDRDAAIGGERDVVWIEVGPPDAADRAAMLVGALERGSRRIDDASVASIASAYPLSPDGLEAAARASARSAAIRGDAIDSGDIVAACRGQLDHRMSALADSVRARVGIGELVIADDLTARLAEMIAYVRHASTVYDRWGFASRVAARGVAALFSGPPGTGKTMAASVLASELGLELFRIDISRVVSKYIGETESNLASVFAEATHSRAILLFDEADALFGKRTDVKSSVDRYSNMEVNYLLQRMEAFDGISILTTNCESAIDEAFRRRLQFRLHFDAPDEALRERLWRTVIPATAEIGVVDHRALARRFDMTGGYIRNAAVRAAFAAASQHRAIAMADLVDAGERELEEMGRLAHRRLA